MIIMQQKLQCQLKYCILQFLLHIRHLSIVFATHPRTPLRWVV